MKNETQRLKDRLRNICVRERKRIKKEIAELADHLRDTNSIFGCGGAYSRQENAIFKREEMLQEIDDFERQLNSQQRLIPASMYVYGCRSCGAVVMTSAQPTDDWHECPACRKMNRPGRLEKKDFQIADEGKSWMDYIREVSSRAKEQEKSLY